MLLKKKTSIRENLKTKSKITNTRGNHNTNRNKKTSIKENLKIKNRINTQGNHNINNNSNKMIKTRHHLRTGDQWLVQEALLQSNILEIHQVENRKLLSDILMRKNLQIW